MAGNPPLIAQQQRHLPSAALGSGFELEEALFSTAPVGLHCVDANGVILWANRTELNFLGISKDEYVGQYVSSFVYSDNVAKGNTSRSSTGGADGQRGGSADGADQQGDGNVNLITADDRTLYNEVLKRVASGNPISEIPVRFLSRSGTVVHLLLDCDGAAILRPGSTSYEGRYFRFFTRDDTARRIQEMRSNVLFQETNRSLQMLDNFMNRSMQQMRAPLTLMERACNLVTENIEDIDEVIRRNAAACTAAQAGSGLAGSAAGIDMASEGGGRQGAAIRRCSGSRQDLRGFGPMMMVGGEDDGGGKVAPGGASAGGIQADFSAPLSVALSATLEARSVVGLATTLTKDALALVDDITDLCRFDQGRVLLIEKEAVKVRDICLEALTNVSVPVGSGGVVDVSLGITEGAPGRTMTDRGVLRRSLALLLNFAVDAAANAASAVAGARGRVMLQVSDPAAGAGRPGGDVRPACKISVFYTNPPDDAGEDATGIAVPTAGAAAADAPATGEAGETADGGAGIARGGSYGTLPAIFGECYSEPADHSGGALVGRGRRASMDRGGSMMRRVRLRESLQSGMTSCRRDKLGLGLSLLYHLVGAQGSDLRYEIVTEPPPSPAATSAAAIGGGRRSVVLPSMTKFWFLLPMSLDFPDRLPEEHIVKDQCTDEQQRQHHRPTLSAPRATARSNTSLLPSSFSMAPDDGLSTAAAVQQPRQKRRRPSLQPASVDPLNSILSVNAFGAMDGASLFNPDSAASVASASSASVSAGVAPAEARKMLIADAASKPGPSAAEAGGRYPGVAPGARPLVLVVEDTDVSASLLCMHLRKLNCTSHRAENGEVAIEMLRSAPAPNVYSLILMDLRMPVMDGFEAARIIKGSNARNVPVVALTGETSEENRRRCDEIGFDDYKTKPLKRPQLKALLNKFVPGYTS